MIALQSNSSSAAIPTWLGSLPKSVVACFSLSLFSPAWWWLQFKILEIALSSFDDCFLDALIWRRNVWRLNLRVAIDWNFKLRVLEIFKYIISAKKFKKAVIKNSPRRRCQAAKASPGKSPSFLHFIYSEISTRLFHFWAPLGSGKTQRLMEGLN